MAKASRTVKKDDKRKPVGRPTGYSLEVAQEICGFVMSRNAETGRVQTLKEWCAQDGKPAESTVFLWLSQHKEFSELYARAREERAELIAEDVIEIADTEADANKARVRIDARKWAAAKLNPKRYGDKIAHVGGSEDDPPIQTNDLSNDARRIAFMLGRAVGQQTKVGAE